MAVVVPAFVLILALLMAVANGAFYTLVQETCDTLQTPASEFNALFGCAKYVTNPTEMRCLSKDEVPKALAAVPEWVFNGVDTISRTYTFADFQAAFHFMTQCAQLVEKNQHHPNWTNLYNTVEVKMSTDDVPCLSTFDIATAA
eukprot:gene38719-47075_t